MANHFCFTFRSLFLHAPTHDLSARFVIFLSRLRALNTDERGRAIHEDCYVIKLALMRVTAP